MEALEKLEYIAHTFNPFTLCEKLNIDIEYINVHNPLGDTIYLHNHPIIMLSNDIKESNQRYFVCAHELSHVVLHNGIQGYYTINHKTKGSMEYQADKLAFMLCTNLFIEDNGYVPSSFSDLQHAYGVPTELESVLF